jgi:hypothetical protein
MDDAGISDTCDRCGRSARIHVGHENTLGYDGLCDQCLDDLTRRD